MNENKEWWIEGLHNEDKMVQEELAWWLRYEDEISLPEAPID